ncbi:MULTISPECIES: AMP-dependent synthetase/ligase [Flavobacteriaceae]|uniref:Long-chain fatty acid--CoA ligase n=2 Tax=Flavobacteriaceae TaxID=49546 RepID=A0A4Y8AVG1_9FLAO|nr:MULTISPECIES: AMP-dependent synthetase/ligase [Flavobacteriaceae]TEW76533.1 long-chain fatty acid--CoA ligase [Gramella jeungdoensis]GGK53772.1 AMP-dependent synthetase [Lutibacter litoralis]
MPKEIKRLFDFAYYQLEKFNLEKAFTTKYNGEWVSISSQEFISQINTVSRGLLKLGVKPGDKIAIISSSNRTEWNIMDLGMSQIGVVNIPIYPTISESDFEYIFNHAEVTHCFLSDKELFDKVDAVKNKVPTLKNIYSFDTFDGCKNWSEILELGKDKSLQKEVDIIKDTINHFDTATIIYTSGTTGKPKGVMLSHNNIVTNVIDSYPRLPLPAGEITALSFLPVCHVFERMLHYLYLYSGTSVYFAESIEKIGENIKEVKPHFMSVVPRLLEKVYDGIIKKGSELTGIKKMLFFWAVEVGLKYEPYHKNGWFYDQKLAIANKLIFSKWREALGGNLTTMVSGSAALQPRLARIFTAARMHIMEGYGLTETSPVVSVNMYKDNLMRIGTVGTAINNVEIKIADDGEILVKGPNIMQGYYKDPERTASVMSGDYFHTGDKGELDADGFLKITGRKKEIFKTSGGKYVAPALLENEMKQSRFIEQILVIGEGQKMPAALIQPNFEFLRDWAKIHHEPIPGNNQDLIENPHIINRIQLEIDKGNENFAKWETIKRFELTPDVWGIDNGLLTPTMKPKREEIIKNYLHLYNKIYVENPR